MRDSTTQGYRAADDSGIPVPSRLQLIELLSDLGQPVTFQALCRQFEIKQKQAKQALSSRLERLQRQGVVIVDRKGRFALPDKMGAFIGRVIGHANGYGFVRPDQGGDDLYLHHRQMRKVLHGDRVVAKLKNIDSRGRKEGVIVEVIVDPDREIVGHFHLEGGVGFVEPDDARFGRDIAIPNEHFDTAQNGDIVVVKVIRHPVQHHHAVGRISHIMGSELAPGMETEIAIRKHEIPNEWPDEVAQQLVSQDKHLKLARLDKGREDIRDLPLVTIDGEDAKDFDDAVYCKPNRQGWRLVVAIADVSHYVKVDSALDREAFNRGNSVYFPNRVIPMLPEMLSNGICSLNPMEDRCCMVCDMQISRAGKILDYSFFPALMHSRARLTYTAVGKIVENKDQDLRTQYAHVVGELDNLFRLYSALAKQRDRRGTINFEFPEPYIHFDDQQRIDRVSVRERNVAHRIIEECMLAANVCAGELVQEHFKDHGIYRNHSGPENESVEDLQAFLKGIGLHLEGGNSPEAADYSRLLIKAKERPEIEGVVQTVLLRSLSQAEYSPEVLGHFALAYPVYTHFTSPIRRYSDLIVHRLIRNKIKQRDSRVGPGGVGVGAIGEHCSFTERRAEDAVRDVVAWLKAEFMQDKVGQRFDGVVSGVKEFGIFIQLDDIFVDGLVHVTALGNDYYQFDPLNFQLVGERSGRRFRLGDRLTVIVSNVDLDLARIDFELASGKTNEVSASGSEVITASSEAVSEKKPSKSKLSKRSKRSRKHSKNRDEHELKRSDKKARSRKKTKRDKKRKSQK
jgi:ribonuclease R